MGSGTHQRFVASDLMATTDGLTARSNIIILEVACTHLDDELKSNNWKTMSGSWGGGHDDISIGYNTTAVHHIYLKQCTLRKWSAPLT